MTKKSSSLKITRVYVHERNEEEEEEGETWQEMLLLESRFAFP